MKIEMKSKPFEPITITIESELELAIIQAAFASAGTGQIVTRLLIDNFEHPNDKVSQIYDEILNIKSS